MSTEKSSLPGEDAATLATVIAPDRNLSRHSAKLVAFAALWFVVSLYAVVIAKALPAKANQEDFSTLYTSATILRQGGNPYDGNLKTSANRLGLVTGKIEHPGDPPTFLLCFEPLTLLRPWPAFWVWTGLNLASLIATLAVLLRREQALTTYSACMIVGLAMLYPPVGDHLLWGQHKLPLLLLLVLVLRWLERGNEAAAGLSLAAAGLLRVFPLLLIMYFLLIGRLRAVIWGMIGLAVGGSVTLELVGFHDCLSFLLGLAYFSGREWTTLLSNISVTATVSRIFLRLHPHMTPAYDIARWVLAYAAALILLGFSIKATVATRSRNDNLGPTFALWVITAILLSPQAWPIDLVLLLIGWVEMAAAAPRGEVGKRALWAGIFSYLAIWIFYIGEKVYFNFLATHQQSLAWTIGAFPAALLAYIAIYWFATDRKAPIPRALYWAAPMMTAPTEVSASP